MSSRGYVSGTPLQKGGGAPVKEFKPKPRSVQEWLDSNRAGTAPTQPGRGLAGAPPSTGKIGARAAPSGAGAPARRPSQPTDSLDQFISSGKIQSSGPSIFGKGAPAKKHQHHKLSAADVWPDGMPDSRPGSSQAQFYDDGEMDAEPQQQYLQPLPQQPAAGRVNSRAAVGKSPFDGGASFGALHGRRAAGGASAGSLGVQGQGQGQGQLGMQAQGQWPAVQYQQQGGTAGGGMAGRRSQPSNGGSTRPW